MGGSVSTHLDNDRYAQILLLLVVILVAVWCKRRGFESIPVISVPTWQNCREAYRVMFMLGLEYTRVDSPVSGTTRRQSSWSAHSCTRQVHGRGG